ncbi:ComEC/Rec2 family competence protein [Pseudarthrobacter sp. J75]|uniref:ComEC/Rec2 family competence protein n=1 Tax=unclassified Pseudarthrobacter TaxID=2647000 RepID=UPI002E8137EC|nr:MULTISPECIES: ComEC/Rec2 family competence protein [unclassified Pseudarthrobacter]MEE2523346.1 ComEC/Rec2 family competence protein [Pseudarthrobacter sp. J47]MEE2529311.1 ComEC/Rec2 family competence protein [Pseudarthrobacter sp. J75]
MTSRAPWQGFIDAAVGIEAVPGSQQAGGLPPAARNARRPPASHWRPLAAHGGRAGRAEAARNKAKARFATWFSAPDKAEDEVPVRRADLRLVPAVVLVWGAAAAGGFLPQWILAVVCILLVAAAAGLVFVRLRRSRQPRAAHRNGLRSRTMVTRPPVRSLHFTVAVALLLAATAAAHSAVASSQRHDTPFAALVAREAGVVVVLEVTGTPRHLGAGIHEGAPEAGNWAVTASVREVTASGETVRTVAGTIGITVMGGSDWESVVPGQLIRAAGKLSASRPGDPEAGVLSAATAQDAAAAVPQRADSDAGATRLYSALQAMRSKYVDSAHFLPPDARGLLPGMVTGDTSSLDPELEEAMRSVGMSHLTAVSGANCSLVMGALLMLLRSFRLARPVAALCALVGLALFVALVGPEPSVVRAAFMGSIAVASLAGGRPGRGLSLVCLAVLALLLFDPSLATDMGFVLSVAATLGIVLLARRMMSWTAPWLPQWFAALLAVPLSAQVMCGPIVILLQPAYSSYSLAANVLAAPLVAPVTVLGTTAVPFVVVLPWLTAALNVPAGLCAAAVAAIARFMAGLPGALLPWSEGAVGIASMCLMSVLSVLLVWALFNPGLFWRRVLVLHSRIEVVLDAAHRARARLGGCLPPWQS